MRARYGRRWMESSWRVRDGRRAALAAALCLAIACAPAPRGGETEAPAPPPLGDEAAGAPPIPEEQQAGELRLEVDRSERELRVLLDGELVETHPVAVGQPDWPTPTGRFAIHQVDWNPDWVPPESEWAEDHEPTAPGDPENPMGRVRMSFQDDYSIHGTADSGSLGQAASHGSIRLANEVITELARVVMRHGGAPRSEQWFSEVLEDPATMRRVPLPDPVPLEIRD
jgi:lipoprotein-anchoring transpeptidase ErfK/SrfK